MDAPSSFKLYGFERLFASNKGLCIRIAHILHLRAEDGKSIDDLLHLTLPKAVLKTVQKYPRIRCRINWNNPLEARVLAPPKTLDEINADYFTTHNTDKVDDWQAYVEKVCQGGEVEGIWKDRSVSSPFRSVLVTNQQDTAIAHLIVFSDHAFSDGYSGLVVLNDILTNCAHPDRPVEPIPNHKSFFEVTHNQTSFLQKMIDKLLIFVGYPILQMDAKAFKPVLPVDANLEEVETFQELHAPFPSKMSFRQGEKKNLKSSLAACRREKVTLNGGIEVCVLVAFVFMSRVFGKTNNDLDAVKKSLSTKFKLAVDVDYNMVCFFSSFVGVSSKSNPKTPLTPNSSVIGLGI